MNLKEMIIKRNSIRKYDMSPLESEILAEVNEIISQTKPLFLCSGSYGFRIVGFDEFYAKTNGMFRINAPHYLLLFGDGSDDAYKNIGYVGELVALKLAEMNIGTCWLGGAKSTEVKEHNEYTISIAFGKPLADFRKSADDAKRKALDSIAEGYNEEIRDILEYVRLAPSAINLQPWHFKCETPTSPEVFHIHIFRNKPRHLFNLIMRKHLEMMQKIDIGIAISHFGVATFEFKKLDIEDEGLIYEGSVCLKMP